MVSQPSPRRPPQQARAKERMERVLDAAEELIAEVGCDGVTTTQIATRAGTSIGSLYEFFGSKHAVAKALSERYLSDFNTVFDKPLATGATDAVVASLVHVIHDFYSRHPGLRPLLDSSGSSEELQAACQAIESRVVDRLDQSFEQHRPAANPRHRHIVAEMCGALLWSVVGEIVTSQSKDRAPLLAELKLVIASYVAVSLPRA